MCFYGITCASLDFESNIDFKLKLHKHVLNIQMQADAQHTLQMLSEVTLIKDNVSFSADERNKRMQKPNVNLTTYFKGVK